MTKELLAAATPAQRRYLTAWAKHGTAAKAAKALGVAVSTIKSARVRAAERAGTAAPAPTGKETRAEVRELKAKLAAAEARAEKLAASIGKARPVPIYKVRAGKPANFFTRVIIPDSHGAHIDVGARDALLGDIVRVDPAEIVLLGDHLDCGGTFSSHQRTYTNEMTESYASDVAACNYFFDELQKRAPRAQFHYLEGNHEQHVERWAARNFDNFADATFALDRLGPEAVLRLKQRGIRYYRRSEQHGGLSIPGTIKLGKCYFTHGFLHSKHAATGHLGRVGANVVFGHVHRVQSVGERTVECDGMGAWCPGTLAKLQPLYRHTAPSDWQHGYAVQFVNRRTGTFVHFNVPMYQGVSFLRNVVDALRPSK